MEEPGRELWNGSQGVGQQQLSARLLTFVWWLELRQLCQAANQEEKDTRKITVSAAAYESCCSLKAVVVCCIGLVLCCCCQFGLAD